MKRPVRIYTDRKDIDVDLDQLEAQSTRGRFQRSGAFQKQFTVFQMVSRRATMTFSLAKFRQSREALLPAIFVPFTGFAFHSIIITWSLSDSAELLTRDDCDGTAVNLVLYRGHIFLALIYINAKSEKTACLHCTRTRCPSFEIAMCAINYKTLGGGVPIPDILPPRWEDVTMAAKTQDAFETTRQTAEPMTERTQETIANYLSWLQNAMQASPWGNTDMNKKLMSYATEAVTAPLSFVQKLSRAKNLEDVVKIQTEFVKAQTDSFNEHAKELGEICTKMVTSATKTPFGMST